MTHTQTGNQIHIGLMQTEKTAVRPLRKVLLLSTQSNATLCGVASREYGGNAFVPIVLGVIS